MIATVLITAAISVLAMLPGPILLRGHVSKPGQLAGAATASLAATMLATALLGELAGLLGHSLPSATLIPVSLTACLASWFAARGRGFASGRPEWQGPALAAAMIALGLYSMALAVRMPADGSMVIHSWYNADWFKHLGHVHALADYGVPAKDIFGDGGPLYYYWLSYILPGAGTALGGDAWAALATFNAVITALFCLTFYGLARMAGASRNPALAATFLSFFVIVTMRYLPKAAFGPGLAQLLADPEAAIGPALLAVPQFIPQHSLVAAMVMAWALLCGPDNNPPRAARLLALASLVGAMTVSTLLGGMILVAYGLVQLAARRVKAVPELAVMAVLAGVLVLALGVLQLGNPGSSLDSPLFGNATSDPWYQRAYLALATMIDIAGLPLAAALLALRSWKPADADARFIRLFAISLAAAAAICVLATQIFLPPRIAIETLIRAGIPVAIAVGLLSAWALEAMWRRGRRARIQAGAAIALLVLVALPDVYLRMAWMTKFGDQYTTVIPADDRKALADLRRLSDARAKVWQYPEAPKFALERGDDAWASVVAGRTVPNSQRATDYAAIAPLVKASERFFAGEDVAIPPAMDWVYLSRALHPDSYDLLLGRMRADAGWRERACYAGACLFEKRTAAR